MEIRLENLTKVFTTKRKGQVSNVVAVNNMNIEIPSGTLVGLLGPSGCGKSTTLYMLSGLQKPTEGKILRTQIMLCWLDTCRTQIVFKPRSNKNGFW